MDTSLSLECLSYLNQNCKKHKALFKDVINKKHNFSELNFFPNRLFDGYRRQPVSTKVIKAMGIVYKVKIAFEPGINRRDITQM